MPHTQCRRVCRRPPTRQQRHCLPRQFSAGAESHLGRTCEMANNKPRGHDTDSATATAAAIISATLNNNTASSARTRNARTTHAAPSRPCGKSESSLSASPGTCQQRPSRPRAHIASAAVCHNVTAAAQSSKAANPLNPTCSRNVCAELTHYCSHRSTRRGEWRGRWPCARARWLLRPSYPNGNWNRAHHTHT